MVKTLRATPGPKGWVLSLHPCLQSQSAVDGALVEALSLGRGLLLDWFRSSVQVPEVWRLELAKATTEAGEISMGLAEELSRKCAARPDQAHEISGPESLIALASVGLYMERRGLSVRHSTALRFLRMAAVNLAILVSLFAWILLLLRGGGGGAPKATDGKLFFAIHGEDSNRTRHVLEVIREHHPAAVILVVGRPRARLSVLGMNWFKGGFGAAAKLLRPWNRISQIRALPQFFGAVNAYRAAVSAEPLHCKLRTRISQLFRCGLGLACANWWSTYGLRDVRVVFGHTGTAETHLLERAIQSSGSETIHAVHGLSSGLNFATYSTTAVWRCGVDANWHERLGTCARDIFVPAELPLVEDRRGERDLLLTSLAHPMNIQYLLRGVAPEVELVEELCKLRQGRGLGLRWRRHPAAERLPARELEVLKDAARRLQISEVGNDCELFADVKMSRRVYCTASTTIVDVLRQGKVPIVVGDTRWASHLIFREVPLLSERMRGTETSDEDAGCDQRLKDVWRSLMPSAPLSPECYLHSGTKQ